MDAAPAAVAGIVVFGHGFHQYDALLVVGGILAIGYSVRRAEYPLHLMPLAAWALRIMVPPLGIGFAIGVEATVGRTGLTGVDLSVGTVVSAIAAAWIVTTLGVIVERRFHDQRRIRIALFGNRELARRLKQELIDNGTPGHEVIGYLTPAHPSKLGPNKPWWLGTISDVRSVVLAHEIDLLVHSQARPPSRLRADETSAPPSRLEIFERVASQCLDLPVRMVDANHLYEERFGHVPLGTSDASWFQYLMHPRYRPGSPFSKRIMDLGLVLLTIPVTLPLFAICALAVKLGDRGSVFFRQRRLGEGGAEFDMLKFRTMTRLAAVEELTITRVGRLLRLSHLNELPQLWNVLKGDMTLVGPRPEEPDLAEGLEERISWYERRHLVKPGVTGWAQNRCGYGGTDPGEAWKLCHDLYYLKHRSVLFDLLIMVQTLRKLGISTEKEEEFAPNEAFILDEAPAPEYTREPVEVAAVGAESELAVAELVGD